MNNVLMIFCIVYLLSSAAMAKEPSQTITADTIQVIRISAQDERAIIKAPDGKMQIIKVGDPIGKTGKVIEIAAGRVVIEEKKGKETEKIIIRLDDGKQKVERMKKTGEKPPMLLAPPEKDKKNQENKKSPKNKNSLY